MPPRKRPRRAPTDDWQQLELLCAFPEQRAYELIRPVVLFGQSPAERAQQTGVTARTVYRKADLFDRRGVAGLLPARPVGRRGRLPAALRRTVAALKAEYPAFTARELARICYVRFARLPSHHTIARVLAQEPAPAVVGRRFPPYRQLATPRQRRLAVVRLHADGWSVSSIAGYLQVSRPTVYQTLARWKAALFAGLEDRSHARQRRALKTDLRAVEAVRRLQENPELGEFRIHAALQQLGIALSPRTCGRILALNRQLYGLGTPRVGRATRSAKGMPFHARRRHQYWTVDVRYLDHRLGGGHVYAISILENHSRAIVASGLFRTQDTAAYLLVLHAAVARYGSPDALVSDGGAVFRATRAQAIYAALGIAKERIEPGEPWQSYIETTFNIQRRMADWHFAQATSWPELLAAHDRWLTDYNAQAHWAHRERTDGRRSPAEVLGWVAGTVHAPEDLRRVFAPVRFGRRLDRGGYARFRRWRIYGERGLAQRPAAVWLHEEALTVEHADEPLAQYVVRPGPKRQELRQVTVLRLFETRFRSAQPPLWEWGPQDWLAVVRVPERRARRRRPPAGVQGTLLPPGTEAAAR